MKHTKFVPTEFSKGLGGRSASSYETANKKMIKAWVKELDKRECHVTEAALLKSLVCWLHNRDSGTRDEAFSFYMECKANQNAMIVDVWPLRDKPDARSYIGF